MLTTIDTLLREWTQRGVNYCHWKSNDRLNESLEAYEDLDILTSPEQRDKITDGLTAAGFVDFRTVWHRRYPDIEDFIAVDPETGRLIHVQPHYSLVIGEKRVKSYRLPWRKDVLDSRVLDERGIYRANANHEAIILLLRTLTKTQGLPSWLFWRYRSSSRELEQARREFAWLSQQIDQSGISRISRAWFGELAPAQTIFDAVKEPTPTNLTKAWNELKPSIQSYRRHGEFRQGGLIAFKDIALAWRLIQRKFGSGIIPAHRVPKTGGLVVAIIGVDGAGKSSLARALNRSLSKKLDVTSVYLGTGKGKPSLLRAPFHAARRLRHLAGANRTNDGGQQHLKDYCPTAGITGALYRLWALAWGSTVRIERGQKLKKIERARKNGLIVTTDRFPQATVEGLNDGPLLSQLPLFKKRRLKWIRDWERKVYACGRRNGEPDIVIRLSVNAQTVSKRRPEMDASWAMEKQRLLHRCEYPGKVIDVDANAEFQSVFAEVTSLVFSELASRQGKSGK